MNILERLFDALVVLQLTALFFFGIAIVLKRWTSEPIERIRITITAFFAVLALFVIVMTPFVPRWSIAVWHASPTVSQEQPPIEITPPTLAQHEILPPAMTLLSENNASLQETPISMIANEPAITATQFAETLPPRHPFPWLSLAKCCVAVGFLAMSTIMIIFHGVALVRLRHILRNAIAAPERVEILFREQITIDALQRRASAAKIRMPSIRVSPKIDSPLMFGLFRPVILLPVSMTLEENMTQTRYALGHEWAHHKHGDLATWGFTHFCRLLFWGQPFYWHLAKELRVDQDFLADDAATQITHPSNITSHTEAENYALVLLELAKRRIMSAAIGQSPALGFADTTPILSRRIEMLLKEKDRLRRKSRWFWLLTTCGLFFGLAVILGSVRFTKTAAGEVERKEPKAAAVTSSGDEKTVELRLLVVDEEKNPVPGAKVELRYSDWFYPIEQYWETDANGMVVTKIPQLVIDNRGRFHICHKERGLIGIREFPTDKQGIIDPMEITCPLIKARRLTGQVLDRNDKPVEGAIVGGTWSFRIGCDRTDDQGHFTIDVPPDRPLQSIFAFKPGVGYDSIYPDVKPHDFWRSLNDKSWEKEGKHDDGPFTFKLDKGKPITVKVVDMEGKPIEDAIVCPSGGVFYENHILESNCFESVMGQKTDKEGLAVFDWIPSWQTQVSFHASGSNPRFDKTGNARFYGEVSETLYEKKDEPLVITLPRRVEIRGSVRHEDGTPVAWCQLCIHGKKFASVGEFTDHAGNFSYDVNAEEPIAVLPITDSSQPLVAPMIRVASVGDGGKPVPRFDFVLKKGTKLHGRVLSPETHEAVPGAYIQIFEMTGPDDTLENHAVMNERYAHADQNGNYGLQLPPGLYRFKVEDREIPDPLEITDEEEIQKDF